MLSWAGARSWPTPGTDFYKSNESDRHVNNLTVSVSNDSETFVEVMSARSTIPIPLKESDDFPFDPGVAGRHIRITKDDDDNRWLSVNEVSAGGRGRGVFAEVPERTTPISARSERGIAMLARARSSPLGWPLVIDELRGIVLGKHEVLLSGQGAGEAKESYSLGLPPSASVPQGYLGPAACSAPGTGVEAS